MNPVTGILGIATMILMFWRVYTFDKLEGKGDGVLFLFRRVYHPKYLFPYKSVSRKDPKEIMLCNRLLKAFYFSLVITLVSGFVFAVLER